MKILVNTLTISRIIGSFIFPFIWFTDNPVIIIVYAMFLMLTDSLDGFLARKYHVETFFGMIMDSVADKFLGVILLFLIATKYKIVYIIIAFEVIIGFTTVFAGAVGVRTNSSILGKLKTWTLGLSILGGLIFMMPYLNLPDIFKNNEHSIINAVSFLCMGSEFIVLSDYLIKYVKEGKNIKHINVNMDIKPKKELKKALFDTKYYLKNKDKPVREILATKR